MRISDDRANAGKRGNFLRGALRIASGDNNFRFWILPARAPDGGPRIPIRRRCDVTGIEQNKVGLRGGGGTCEAPLFELMFKGRAVGLVSTATEILHVKSRHGNMVAQCLDFAQGGHPKIRTSPSHPLFP